MEARMDQQLHSVGCTKIPTQEMRLNTELVINFTYIRSFFTKRFAPRKHYFKSLSYTEKENPPSPITRR